MADDPFERMATGLMGSLLSVSITHTSGATKRQTTFNAVPYRADPSVAQVDGGDIQRDMREFEVLATDVPVIEQEDIFEVGGIQYYATSEPYEVDTANQLLRFKLHRLKIR